MTAGSLLVEQCHQVVRHARDDERTASARAALPGAEAVVIGDLSTLAAMHDVADQANTVGKFDAAFTISASDTSNHAESKRSTISRNSGQ